MICSACHRAVTGDILDHYRTCAALAEMFPIRPKPRVKSARLCVAPNCRKARAPGVTRCKEHERNRALMEAKRKRWAIRKR